jgi:hypothetical protein
MHMHFDPRRTELPTLHSYSFMTNLENIWIKLKANKILQTEYNNKIGTQSSKMEGKCDIKTELTIDLVTSAGG